VTGSPQRGSRRIYARPAGDTEAEWDAFVEQFNAQIDALIAEAEAESTDATEEVEPPTSQPTEGAGQAID
jgi:hypothetical protein